MKHTPGPWGINADGIKAGDHENGFQPFDACGCCSSPWMSAKDDQIGQADANLICAAPLQHQALLLVRQSVVFDELEEETRQAVIAALAAAQGE